MAREGDKAAAGQGGPGSSVNPVRADVVSLGPRVDEEALRVLYASVLRLWDVVDDLTRLRPERSATYSVSIFGSARIVPGCHEYEDVRRLAAALAGMGCTVLTGGGPGLMQAANEGARQGAPDHPERSVGIRIALEFEESANPFVVESHEHRTFFSRLHHFVLRSSAFVVTPGGVGTALELMTIWQLLQVRKLTGTPLVGGMWTHLLDWAKAHMSGVDVAYVDPVDLTLPLAVETVEEAVEIVRSDYRAWEQGHPETA